MKHKTATDLKSEVVKEENESQWYTNKLDGFPDNKFSIEPMEIEIGNTVSEKDLESFREVMEQQGDLFCRPLKSKKHETNKPDSKSK